MLMLSLVCKSPQGLLSGKLDPANGVLRVKTTMARDVKQADIAALIEALTAW